MQKVVLIARHHQSVERSTNNEIEQFPDVCELVKELKSSKAPITSIFVKRNDDATYGNIARELREMRFRKFLTPYKTRLDF